MKKLYIITFDPHRVDTSLFHSAVTESPGLTHWWHYLASTYLIESTATLQQVQDHMMNKMPGTSFLLLKITDKTAAGWLPKDAWDWIKQH